MIRFKSGYMIDVSQYIDELPEIMREWEIPIKDESDGMLVLDKPWDLVYGTKRFESENSEEGYMDVPQASLQIVLIDEEFTPGCGMVFSPKMGGDIVVKLKQEHEGLFNHLFQHGYCALHSVAYTWDDEIQDEPYTL